MHPESIEALAAGTVSEQCALELVLVLEQIADRLVRDPEISDCHPSMALIRR
jgi:hypothetical protein